MLVFINPHPYSVPSPKLQQNTGIKTTTTTTTRIQRDKPETCAKRYSAGAVMTGAEAHRHQCTFNVAVRWKLTRERHVRRLRGLEAAQLGAGAVGARALLHAVPVHGLLIAL